MRVQSVEIWIDATTTPTGLSSEQAVDADFWAIATGGVGADRVLGYSLVDLDVLAGAETTGLLDILLDGIIGTTCTVSFVAKGLSADATCDLRVEASGHAFAESLSPILR